MKFKGGYIFKNFQGAAEPILKDLPVPDKVFLRLPQIEKLNFSPLVAIGQKVKSGEIVIGNDGTSGICMVSPVNGTVAKADETGIEIISDGSSDTIAVKGHIREPWNLSGAEIYSLLSSTGCILAMGDDFLQFEDFSKIDSIIISSIHNSVLNQKWSPDIDGNGHLLTAGTNVLKKLSPKASVYLAVNSRNEEFFKKAESDSSVKVVDLADRYPQENPELLAKYILKRRLYNLDGSKDKSILIISYSDLIRIAATLTEGRPLVDKTYLVAGPGVSNPGWYRIRIGTTLDFIAGNLFKSEEYGPWRVLKGEPLYGTAVTDMSEPLTINDHEISVISDKAVRELLRFIRPGFEADSYSRTTVANFISLFPKKLESSMHGGERPCIQCNYCDEVCPVDIYPFLIWKFMMIGEIESTFRLKPYECIGCGLCSYVCPSKINLAESVKAAREAYFKSRKKDESD